MTHQDNIRLVGELVTVTGAVIILLLEVSAGGTLAEGIHLRPQAEVYTGLFLDPRHFQSWCLSLFWTDHPRGTLPCHHVSVSSF